MTRGLSSLSIAACIATMLWTFLPVPAGVDPDGYVRFFGLFPIAAGMMLLGILVLYRGVSGSGTWWLGLFLVSLPLTCLFAVGGGRVATALCAGLAVVGVVVAWHDLRHST